MKIEVVKVHIFKTQSDIMSKEHFNLLTPSEVIEHYPELFEKLGWTNKDIGVFYAKGLLKGCFSYKLKKSMIRETSLKRLVVFANSIQTEKLIRSEELFR